MTHWWSGAQGVAVSNPAWTPSMKPLFVPKFASHSQDATSVARLTGASAYEHPEELLQPKKRRTVRTADIKFDPLPGPPPLRCSVPGCGRPTFPDWPGERACMVHGEARRPLPPEYVERAQREHRGFDSRSGGG